ncbi:hypothetical protein KIPB_014631, partial [Kipferlia bialata]
ANGVPYLISQIPDFSGPNSEALWWLIKEAPASVLNMDKTIGRIVKKGGNPNWHTLRKVSCLACAVKFNPPAVRILLSHGATTDSRLENGMGLVEIAVTSPHDDKVMCQTILDLAQGVDE